MKKMISIIAIFAVVFIIVLFFLPTNLVVNYAEVSHKSFENEDIDFMLSAEDVNELGKVLKASQMRFRGNVLKLEFHDYLSIKVNDSTWLYVGTETTAHNNKIGHYVFLVRSGKYEKAAFIKDDSYVQISNIMNKYDKTIPVK